MIYFSIHPIKFVYFFSKNMVCFLSIIFKPTYDKDKQIIRVNEQKCVIFNV